MKSPQQLPHYAILTLLHAIFLIYYYHYYSLNFKIY